MAGIPPIDRAAQAASPAAGRLREACRDLEGVFMRRLVAGMRATVPQGGLLGQSPGSSLYESMVDETLASALTDAGGLGLADLLYGQLYGPAVENEDAVR